ncbi:hypothetical protein ACTXJ8_14825 [Corynebacterium variabile]|uniref:hypothetical protein n=1 Tax=Corynebacterium variabile TaxID=1727 RepID=UPI002648912F|nr:hypothetical protein [Corynebacterium variabile]MDN6845945.1 hypothetical protein [Corynebacterium variabile]
MTDKATPPTDEQIIQAFRDYIAERAGADNQWAQSVTDVSFADGRVTITLDPEQAGDEHGALLTGEMQDPIESLMDPVGFNNDTSRWLRQRVQQLTVKDVDGRKLSEISTAELAERNYRNNWRHFE